MKCINKRVDKDKMNWHIKHLEKQGYILQDIKATSNGNVKHAIFNKMDENGEVIERLTLQPHVPVKYTGSHGWSNLKQIKKDGE